MTAHPTLGVYGFRFLEIEQLALCGLYAVGHEIIRNPQYSWNGLVRSDGPLLLFQYTISGEGKLDIDGITYKLSAGQAFMVNIPSEHHYYFSRECGHWEIYFVLFRPHIVQPIWEEIRERMGGVSYFPKQSKPIVLLSDMIRDARRGEIDSVYAASAYVYTFMMALSAYAFRKGDAKQSWSTAIKLAAEYMENNYANLMGQEQLAEQFGMSKYKFIRLFSKTVGVTPGEYVSRIRVDHAIKLLLETDFTIDEIAVQLGYSSGSYLIRVFQKLVGQTPAKFRASNELFYKHIYFD